MSNLGTVSVLIMVGMGHGRYKQVTVFRRAMIPENQAKKEVMQFCENNPQLAKPELMLTPKWQAEPVEIKIFD